MVTCIDYILIFDYVISEWHWNLVWTPNFVSYIEKKILYYVGKFGIGIAETTEVIVHILWEDMQNFNLSVMLLIKTT